MRAAVYKGNQRFEVEEIPTPSPGPGQILVDITYCAICGTDVHGFLYDLAPPGTILGVCFSIVLATCWRVLVGHAFRRVSKLFFAGFVKDLGNIFVTSRKVLESSSDACDCDFGWCLFPGIIAECLLLGLFWAPI